MDDTTNPPIMQEWWKENLPGAELMKCRKRFGHLHPADVGVFHELLRRMMGQSPNNNFHEKK